MSWHEGEQIGPYVLERRLGQGGMAAVYKGYHQQLDRHVAIKVMLSTYETDNNFVSRFTREAQIVARLEHPHIVPVYDFNQHDGLPYLVMKYIEGKTLKQRMMKAALPLEEILSLTRTLADALTYAHKQGVLHRDIKPSNILIDQNYVPYLTDFGLARISQAGESTLSADMLLGTPHYIAPEQARGEKQLDGRTDIYSFGVVLYEMLVGQVPFTGDTPYAIIHNHIFTPLPLPSRINPEIPLEVEAVLAKALAKHPQDRYETAYQLSSALEHAVRTAALSELNPERRESSEQSLAALRASLNDAFTSPPPPQLAESVVRDSPSLAKPTNTDTSRKPRKNQNNSGFWPALGCGGFLLSVFLSLLILTGAADSIMQLSQLDLRTRDIDDNSVQYLDEVINAASDIDFAEIAGQIPEVSIAEARESIASNPEQTWPYLLLARAMWEDGSEIAAYRSIATGVSTSENPAVYLTIAAILAQEVDDEGAALGYMILALGAAQGSPEIYDQIRPIITQYLYENAEATGRVTLQALFSDLLLNTELSGLDLDRVLNSPGALYVTTIQRLQRDTPRLAVISVNQLDRATDDIQPEIELLHGEIALAQNRPDSALNHWRAILEDIAAPEWVRARALEFIQENKQNS